jgi:dTDP-4-amino-4,6-dideoxygalactose transaminase
MAPFVDDRAPSLPVTEELCATNLALPMTAVLRERDVEDIVAAVADFSRS